MFLHILAVGDVVGQGGVTCLSRHLRALQKEHDIHFTVVNGENAAGLGLLPHHAEEIFDAGADVITLGNHTWGKLQIKDYLEDNPCILRPANFAPNLPGRGFGIYGGPQGLRLGVMNLMGRFELDSNLSSPFLMADQLLAEQGAQADLIFVDFHAEATSEKKTLGLALDGRVSAVFGTHTHVQCADAQILPQGTGYLTDLGMCGVEVSSLGMDASITLQKFLTRRPVTFKAAQGQASINGLYLDIDDENGLAREVRLIRVDTPPDRRSVEICTE